MSPRHRESRLYTISLLKLMRIIMCIRFKIVEIKSGREYLTLVKVIEDLALAP